MVEVRRIEDPQLPLRVGIGVLPNWLRYKKGMLVLDHYDDELCVFRCIAVLQGARKDRNTRRAQELAESFFAAHDIPNSKISIRHFPLIEKHFYQGFAAYEVNEAGTFTLKYMPSRFVSHWTKLRIIIRVQNAKQDSRKFVICGVMQRLAPEELPK